MNLFKELRSRYGQETVKNVRDLESFEKKIARHRNHLTFTHRCKDSGITPNSLKLRCPINTIKARNIIQKAQNELVRERIRVVSNRIADLTKTSKKLHGQVLETLESKNDGHEQADVRRHLEIHLENKRKTEHEKSKERQIKKLNNLKDKNEDLAKKRNAVPDIDLSGTQLKKWVVNNTERKLTDSQNSLLAKGLNFAVSVDRIPNEDFIVAAEKVSWKLPPGEAQNLRAEVAGVLKSAKIPKSNISKEERVALKQLKKDKSIIIMGADKGRSTVVTSTDGYEEKVNNLLSDEKTYEKLKGDPTSKYKRKLLGTLQRLKKENKIDNSQYKLLYPTAENTPRIYCTTKIHKEGYPVRPIVDYTGSIAYQTSKALAEILSPMVGKTAHHVTNSRELAEELATVRIDDEDILIHMMSCHCSRIPLSIKRWR
ncbi:uncharacterized protein [Amphiura filiformis]|uniref:uncharacterized protein n=1 Tax=Amphiura filiformis TaxID=82378 RepID=UPI003B215B53